ncbi:MAG: hypothetical protein GYA51_12615 [Candidatus Methanofastidiosa archaeon]|nr:hypothetical protein [Candidatus Methanofastidiosa archaeon]
MQKHKIIDIVFLGAGSALELYAPYLSQKKYNLYVCDLINNRADNAAQIYGFNSIPADIKRFPIGATVINLTPPSDHGLTNIEMLDQGYSVFSEKPAAHEKKHLEKITQLMSEGARFAVAPDTHLSQANKIAQSLYKSGKFGRAISIRGIYHTKGHELWHPRPEMFYKKGGGVCLDILPYFLRSIESMFGRISSYEVERVLGSKIDLISLKNTNSSIPLQVTITFITEKRQKVDLDLSFCSRSFQSNLIISFINHDIVFDPVDAGSDLRVIDHFENKVNIIVQRTKDIRGIGVEAFVSKDETDKYFGLENIKNFYREQTLLLNIDHGPNKKFGCLLCK